MDDRTLIERAAKAPSYELRTIGDLLKVPAEKRAACFKDLELALSLHELAFGEDSHPSQVGVLTWVDDDSGNATLIGPDQESFLTLEVTKSAASLAMGE